MIEDMQILQESVQEIALYFEQLTRDNATLLQKSTTMMDFIETQSAQLEVHL